MNCLEFRRALGSRPAQLEEAAAAHAAQCPACRQVNADALELEERVEKALRVPAPPDLEEKVLARLGRRRASRWYAIAASVLLGAGVAATVPLWRDDPLARAGIDFVVYEEAQAIADAKPADRSMLERVSREMRVALPAQLGEVRYVCFYPFSAGTAHHLLVNTAFGKATLLLIPGLSVASRAAASANGLHAAVLPVPGGAAAIIAGSSRSVSRIETLLRSM